MTFYIILVTLFFKGGLVENRAIQCWDTKTSCEINESLIDKSYTDGIFKIESTDQPVIRVESELIKKVWIGV